MTAAQTCKRRGWIVGTRLIGDEGHGPTVIEITAIGREQVLAVTISHNGKPPTCDYEGSWDLDCRKWNRVTAGEPHGNE